MGAVAAERLLRDGPNELRPPRGTPECVKFGRQLAGGLQCLMWVAAAICLIAYGVQEGQGDRGSADNVGLGRIAGGVTPGGGTPGSQGSLGEGNVGGSRESPSSWDLLGGTWMPGSLVVLEVGDTRDPLWERVWVPGALRRRKDTWDPLGSWGTLRAEGYLGPSWPGRCPHPLGGDTWTPVSSQPLWGGFWEGYPTVGAVLWPDPLSLTPPALPRHRPHCRCCRHWLLWLLPGVQEHQHHCQLQEPRPPGEGGRTHDLGP